MTEANYFSKLSYLMLEANSSCNLECVFCNRKELEKQGLRSFKLMSEEELCLILEQVKDCPIRAIKFQGLSEPMMHPKFSKLCKMIRDYFPGVHLTIATNLQYNLKNSPFLDTLQFVDMVYLSVDGGKKNYEKLRPPSKWTSLIESLEAIKKYVDQKIRNEKLHIQFIASDENYKDLPEIYKLKHQYGLSSVRINLAQNWFENYENPHQFSEDMINYIRTNYIDDMLGVLNWDYSDCFWPFNGTMIDVYGEVRKCVIKTDTQPIGNVYNTPLHEIYNHSEFMNSVRGSLNKNKPHASCSNCDYYCQIPVLSKLFDAKNDSRPFKKVLPAT